MGMRDESWCQSCGCSITYGQEECGDCANDGHYQDKIKLINYMKLHLISLMQDTDKLENEMELIDINSKDWADMDMEMLSLNGQIIATRHLMSVAADIMGIQLEEK